MLNQHFNRVCDNVWCLLETSWIRRFDLSETTVTDRILLWLHENRALSSIQVAILAKTSYADEPVRGTDWEWWIGNGRHGWSRYAVQAKKLSHQENGGTRYHSLKQRAGQSLPEQFQHEVLARYARENHAVPIYAFYNYVRKTDYASYWQCKCAPYRQGKSHRDASKLGITVTPLKNVESAVSDHGQRSFEAIHEFPETVSMRCLACPKGEKMYRQVGLSVQERRLNPPEIFRKEKFSGNVVILGHKELPGELYNHDLGYYPKRIIKIETSES